MQDATDQKGMEMRGLVTECSFCGEPFVKKGIGSEHGCVPESEGRIQLPPPAIDRSL